MTESSGNNPTQAVFDSVLARPVAVPDLHHGRLVHVTWSAPAQGERLVQFYVDGELTGFSRSPSEREAWLLLSAEGPHQIELLAVRACDAATPSPKRLAGIEPAVEPAAVFTLMRGMSLPIDARLSVTVDGQPAGAGPLFATDTPRGGFGSVFGEGGFGADAATGPGLGLGRLGYGPLGIDGDALVWRHEALLPGAHTLQLSLRDAAGRPVAEAIELEGMITRLPAPPSEVSLGDDLKLTWT